MDQDIKKILEAAILAPSGENAQPWQFHVENNLIHLFNVPERDQSLYNWGQRASYVAHGAALENTVIAAGQYGYNVTINLFPDRENLNFVAVVALEKTVGKEEPLFVSIAKRVTNRKPYETKPLSDMQRSTLLAVKHERAQFAFTENRDIIKQLGRVGSANEEVMLSNKMIHNFFFSHVNWTEEEELKKRYGFYIKTLELPPPAQIMFKLFRHWGVMRVFNILGFPKIVAKQNAKVNASASAVGIITIPTNSPEDFICAGRLTQRVWLTATKLGLSIQPMTGILFFMLRILVGDDSEFSEAQKILIRSQYMLIKRSFNVNNETIAMMFRIGIGKAPSAQSAKYTLQQLMRV